MRFFDWLGSKLGSGEKISVSEQPVFWNADADAQLGTLYIQEMAFWSTVGLIARAVGKCEFKTFENGAEIRKKEYYLWNIEPNKNQNSSGFIGKWIARLYRDNECLIVPWDRQLLIADSFMRQPYTLYDDLFSQVTVGDFTFNRTFNQSEVLYWQLADQDVKSLLAGLFAGYDRLLKSTVRSYTQGRTTKGIYKYDSLPVAGDDEKKEFNRQVNIRIKQWLEAEKSAALTLGKGQEWKAEGTKTYSSENTRDVRALIDDISDFTAKAFGIPAGLLSGKVAGTKDATEGFLTFCIDPLADMLQEEIMRKRYGYAEFAKGNYLKIDTTNIRNMDVYMLADNIRKIISSGAFSINEVRKRLGETAIDEPWADKHILTKNYGALEDALTTLAAAAATHPRRGTKGGETK